LYRSGGVWTRIEGRIVGPRELRLTSFVLRRALRPHQLMRRHGSYWTCRLSGIKFNEVKRVIDVRRKSTSLKDLWIRSGRRLTRVWLCQRRHSIQPSSATRDTDTGHAGSCQTSRCSDRSIQMGQLAPWTLSVLLRRQSTQFCKPTRTARGSTRPDTLPLSRISLHCRLGS
jgi:hypothetical protein